MSRVPIAVVAGVGGLILYVMAVVALADHFLGLNWAIQAAYYLVAGIAWVFPMQKLMYWAARR
jgi:hypothetical protein